MGPQGFRSSSAAAVAAGLTMDSIFALGEPDRAAFLRHMMQSFAGCSYICLWSSFPLPSNCLIYSDGAYEDQTLLQNQPSLARRLFSAYSESVNYIDYGRLPGQAFKNNVPYMEFKLDCLLRLASSEIQMQFYQEAGVKAVVFMGCNMGEIELGLSREPQIDLRMEMRKWFPTDFLRETMASGQLLQLSKHSLHATSSASMNSLSLDSSDYSYSYPYSYAPSLFDIPNEAFFDDAPIKPSAPMSSFTRYQKTTPVPANVRGDQQGRRPSLFKRSVMFFRNLNTSMRRENRPTPTQVQHMISERRRREKLNDSFQALRLLLPPGSKKDKASVLNSITDQLVSLKSQVEELEKRNRDLEAQLTSTAKEEGKTSPSSSSSSSFLTHQTSSSSSSFSTHQTVNVGISPDSTSTQEARVLNLSVGLSSRKCSALNLVRKVLKLLRKQRNVSLLSMKSNTKVVEENLLHALVLRLKIEGTQDFGDSAFQEAVTRALLHLQR